MEDMLLKNQIVEIRFYKGNVYRELQAYFRLVCNASLVIKGKLWLRPFA